MFTVAEKIMIERKKQRGRKKEKLTERRGEKGRVCLNDMIIIYSSPYCEFQNDLPQFSLSLSLFSSHFFVSPPFVSFPLSSHSSLVFNYLPLLNRPGHIKQSNDMF